MIIKNITYVFVFLSFALNSPATVLVGLHVTDITTPGGRCNITIGINPAPILIAQNDVNRVENESKPSAAEKERESPSEEEPAKSSGDRSSGKKTKQLKPFIPSEEIAAEQAVDFPSDI